MAMTPLALTLLGVEPAGPRRRPNPADDAEIPAGLQHVPELRPIRPSRTRPTSYYNSFQTICSSANDEPPSYQIASRHRAPPRPPHNYLEALPKYSCTVEMGGKVLIQLESINPLHDPTESEWRELYLVLRGTLLSFYKVKDNGPGKLLRSYTLQHAEVGLAPDSQHTVLVPQTRLAHLIPSSARRRAWQKDPDLFRPVRQHLMRLRIETDQIVLADACEEEIHSWITAISAGIDVAHAIDERAVPRQCTVPRRRRRQRASDIGNITDPIVIAEQERILRDMYPAFAEQIEQAQQPASEQTTPGSTTNLPISTPTREEEEVDISAMREDAGGADVSSLRPTVSRNVTSSSVNTTYSEDMMYATSPANFSGSGKWEPPHTRTASQVQRYVRRCMPILLAEAVRASDVLICNGKRVKINWRMELLEEWELQPPTYKSHRFGGVLEDVSEPGLGLERTHSQNSASTTSAATPAEERDNPLNSTSNLGTEGEDEITSANPTGRVANLTSAKSAVVSATVMDKASTSPRRPLTNPARYDGQDIHGVVFCF